MTRRSIALATDAAFFPPYQGDAARLHRMIAFLRRRHWAVHVIHFHDRDQRDVDYVAMSRLVDSLVVYYPSESDLARRRRSSEIDAWCPDAFVALVRDICRRARVDALFAQFVFLSRCLEGLDDADGLCKVLDADNIFTGRREKFLAAGVPYTWFSTSLAEEHKGWRRADVLLSVQEHELEIIQRVVPHRPVILVPYAQDVIDTGAGDGRSILFVGADNDANVSGLREFVAHALPAIRQRHPAATLAIAGRVGEHFRGIPGVSVLGVVDDLSACYREASIVINVMACGTGLKTKTIEALCFGKCLVSTPAGIEGLESYPDIYRLACTPVDFACTIGGLLERPDEMQRLRSWALRFARSYFAAEIIFQRLETAVLSFLDATRCAHDSGPQPVGS